MARIRTIKPTFWADEKIATLPRMVRLTFLGVISAMADDHGRARANPRLVAAAVYPLDEDVLASEVAQHLELLAERGLISLYDVAGERYLHVINWSKHQKINRPSDSQLPAPQRRKPHAIVARQHEPSLRVHGKFSEDSVSLHAVVEGKGEEGSVVDVSASPEAGKNGSGRIAWSAEGAAIWQNQVGHISVGHFGKALKPVVEKYGWPDTRSALLTYIELNEGKTRKVEWMANDAVRWIDLAKMPCVDPETRELTEKGQLAYNS